MMKKLLRIKFNYKNLKTLFLTAIVLSGCDRQKHAKKQFFGDWQVQRQPYSHATLRIYPDHSFIYNERGHMDRSYSEGVWNLRGETLVLDSQKPQDCRYLVSFGKKQQPPEPTPRNPMKFFLGFTSIPGCEPEPFSDAFVEFKKERFLRAGDSLVYLDLDSTVLKQYGNYKIYKR